MKPQLWEENSFSVNDQAILEIKDLKTYFFTYKALQRPLMVLATNWLKGNP